MKALYNRFREIETLMRRGLITLQEGNERMIRAIEAERDRVCEAPDWQTWDSLKAYHRMYMILADLTKAGREW